jgi:hypothetical protein
MNVPSLAALSILLRPRPASIGLLPFRRSVALTPPTVDDSGPLAPKPPDVVRWEYRHECRECGRHVSAEPGPEKWSPCQQCGGKIEALHEVSYAVLSDGTYVRRRGR